MIGPPYVFAQVSSPYIVIGRCFLWWRECESLRIELVFKQSVHESRFWIDGTILNEVPGFVYDVYQVAFLELGEQVCIDDGAQVVGSLFLRRMFGYVRGLA